MKKKLFWTACFLLVAAFPAASAHAATITWVAASPSNWNVSSSWSSGAVPTTSDIALFSASSTQNASINTNGLDVAGLQITSGYTGTITQAAVNAFSVGASDFVQAGGTYAMNSGQLSVNGNFSMTGGTFSGNAGNVVVKGANFALTGGTFTAPSGTLQLYGASSTFQNTFQNNSGTVVFSSTSTAAAVTGSTTFFALQLGTSVNNNYYLTVTTGTILTAQGDFIMGAFHGANILLGGGGVNVQGNIDGGTAPYDATGTVPITLTGTGTQVVGNAGPYGSTLLIPNLTITKTSGGVTLANHTYVEGNWTNTNATPITPGTSTVTFQTAATSSFFALNGSSTFYNLEFAGSVAYTDDFITIATGTVLTVTNDLMMTTNGGTNHLLGGGEIDVQGNIDGGNSSWGFGADSNFNATGTASVVLNGTSTQILANDVGNGTFLHLPNLTITKTSGGVTIANPFIMHGNWTNTNATPITPGSSTVYFQNHNATGTFTLTGSSTFAGLSFGGGNGTVTVAAGTVITVRNDLTIDPAVNSYVQWLGAGEVDVAGNIGGGRSILSGGTSTVSIVLNGTSTQMIDYNSQSSGFYGTLWLPNLTVNKPSGIALIDGTAVPGPVITGNMTVASGEFRVASGTPATTFEVDGTVTVNSGAILSDYPQASSTFSFGSSITNNGTIFFDSAGNGCGSTLPNYVILRSTSSTVQRSWSGSGNFVMDYVDVKDQGGSGATITVLNGTDSGNNSLKWAFSPGPRAHLIQTASGAGGSGTTQITLPSFGFQPRAGDLILVAVSARGQSIIAPTDNASNTYSLVASTTFNSSPMYAVSLYYAKNIVTTSSFAVTAKGANASAGSFLTAAAFDYTNMAPSSTFDTYSSNKDTSGNAVSLTSLSATAQSQGELYFGTMTLTASTTASAGSGWTSEAGFTNNATGQALYTEDMATTSILTTAATWTSATSTNYGAIMGLFRTPFSSNYTATGTLDSATFDTGVASGAQYNSIVWRGTAPAGTAVKFQLAVSNASGGPWNFFGPDPGNANSYFTGDTGASISLVSTTNGYNLFSGYRYFRYRITLFSDPAQLFTPTVNGVVVNWSP